MQPYRRQPWRQLEILDGEEQASGDTWRKLVQTEEGPVLMLQRGGWCGVRHDVFLLETPEEEARWRIVELA
ncbi:MAG: hypothetical protein HQL76_14095 [Magnetococcales bacterium]|nr:hypothetical protein [Magnetococcales bacterium]